MKKVLIAVLSAVFIIAALAACGDKVAGLAGVWSLETYGGELTVEFTADGRFIDRVSGEENRYTADGHEICVYVEGEEESAVRIPYEIKGDKLYFGKDAVYTRVTSENS